MASHIDKAWILKEIASFNKGLISLSKLCEMIPFHLGVRGWTPEMTEVLSAALVSYVDSSAQKPRLKIEYETLMSFVRSIMNSAVTRAHRQEAIDRLAGYIFEGKKEVHNCPVCENRISRERWSKLTKDS